MDENRINIGEFDTQVALYSVTQSRGTQGQKTITRTLNGTVWAKVETLTDEFVSDDNLEARTTVSVSTYKIQGLNTRWELEINGVPYEIRGIDPISRWSPLCVITAETIQR